MEPRDEIASVVELGSEVVAVAEAAALRRELEQVRRERDEAQAQRDRACLQRDEAVQGGLKAGLELAMIRTRYDHDIISHQRHITEQPPLAEEQQLVQESAIVHEAATSKVDAPPPAEVNGCCLTTLAGQKAAVEPLVRYPPGVAPRSLIMETHELVGSYGLRGSSNDCCQYHIYHLHPVRSRSCDHCLGPVVEPGPP